MADAAGATVAGIDTSDELITIARARTPSAELRIGSVYELPWDDASASGGRAPRSTSAPSFAPAPTTPPTITGDR